MNSNILLVEPGFRTKFPPMGLMKISSYHKLLNDSVTFVKGISSSIAYEKFWDRIYISTVFTYNWKSTVDSINFYKAVVKGDTERIFVGGILATLMPKELWEETGIVPITGLLDSPGSLREDNNIIVDKLLPDYELFNNTNNDYSLLGDSYFGYSTRGCVRDCSFCAVNTLEPEFEDYTGIKPYINGIIEKYGEKQNLVLFDNNIVASEKFEKVIDDIMDLGFHKESKFMRRQRKVDFNQGTDARLMNDSNMELLSRIAINPLRIAFDYLKMEKEYSKAIRLAAKYEIKYLSNYILYNFKDTPDHLWKRLKINIDLNKELELKIYSFPMKYIPLNAKDRTYIDEPRWNWYYIRGVQRITNVLKGAVMPDEGFFNRAFGESIEEFYTILHMPEEILMSRGKNVGSDEIDWLNKYNCLSKSEKKQLLSILCTHKKSKQFQHAIVTTKSRRMKNILEYYMLEHHKNQLNLELHN